MHGARDRRSLCVNCEDERAPVTVRCDSCATGGSLQLCDACDRGLHMVSSSADTCADNARDPCLVPLGASSSIHPFPSVLLAYLFMCVSGVCVEPARMALHRRIPIISMRGLRGPNDADADAADDATGSELVSSLAAHLQQLSTAASTSNAMPAAPAVATTAASDSTSAVYCICRQGDDGVRPMIDCSACDEWFHLECIGQISTLLAGRPGVRAGWRGCGGEARWDSSPLSSCMPQITIVISFFSLFFCSFSCSVFLLVVQA